MERARDNSSSTELYLAGSKQLSAYPQQNMLLRKTTRRSTKGLRKRSNHDQSNKQDKAIHSLDFFPGVAAIGRSGFLSQQLWLDLIDDGGLIPDALGSELAGFSLESVLSLISLLFFHD